MDRKLNGLAGHVVAEKIVSGRRKEIRYGFANSDDICIGKQNCWIGEFSEDIMSSLIASG